jgi:hypothetical protein
MATPVTIVQGIGPNLWKWTVRLDEKTVKSGAVGPRSSYPTSWAIAPRGRASFKLPVGSKILFGWAEPMFTSQLRNRVGLPTWGK